MIARGIVGSLILAAILGAIYQAYQFVEVELPLRHEEERLLTANAPAVKFPGCSVTLTSDGDVVLPDGRTARIAELDLSAPVDQKRLASDVAFELRHIKGSEAGYTITSTDPSGMPVVHIWVLSPVEYEAICGNSSSLERRRGRMRVWRNLSAMLLSDRGYHLNADTRLPVRALGD
jgi:hypothetical protein